MRAAELAIDSHDRMTLSCMDTELQEHVRVQLGGGVESTSPSPRLRYGGVLGRYNAPEKV